MNYLPLFFCVLAFPACAANPFNPADAASGGAVPANPFIPGAAAVSTKTLVRSTGTAKLGEIPLATAPAQIVTTADLSLPSMPNTHAELPPPLPPIPMPVLPPMPALPGAPLFGDAPAITERPRGTDRPATKVNTPATECTMKATGATDVEAPAAGSVINIPLSIKGSSKCTKMTTSSAPWVDTDFFNGAALVIRVAPNDSAQVRNAEVSLATISGESRDAITVRVTQAPTIAGDRK